MIPTTLRAALLAMSLALTGPLASPLAAQTAPAVAAVEGVRTLRSPNSVDETVARIKADVAAKGIRFFDDIDQGSLAKGAAIDIRPSRLVLFGNPPLGTQFLSANPLSGLDWPVRMLVFQAADGGTVIAWQDFDFMARRYALKDRAAQVKMAGDVAASIAAAGAAR